MEPVCPCMGRLTLNVLLSFAQFEREVIGERVRDKIAASKRKGLWVGGPVPLGYRPRVFGKRVNGMYPNVRVVSTPVENCEPNFRKGGETGHSLKPSEWRQCAGLVILV
jgi:hypothetical protein